jgi:hypothetical protein
MGLKHYHRLTRFVFEDLSREDEDFFETLQAKSFEAAAMGDLLLAGQYQADLVDWMEQKAYESLGSDFSAILKKRMGYYPLGYKNVTEGRSDA